MNHPKTEDWIPYIYNELDGPQRRELEEHLGQCAPCRAQVEAWQRTQTRLDEWKLPPPGERTVVLPMFKWAAAAAVILGIGFLAGRWSSPSPEQMAALARTEVRNELRTSLLVALAPENPAQAEPFQRELRQEIQAVLLRANTNALRSFQAEEHRATLTLFKQMEERQASYYLSLRHDLETLAADADDRLRQNGRQIVQLASAIAP